MDRPNLGKKSTIQDFFPSVAHKRRRKDTAQNDNTTNEPTGCGNTLVPSISLSESNLMDAKPPVSLTMLQMQTTSSTNVSTIVPGPLLHSKKNKHAVNKGQLYLDFGQVNFAKQIVCPGCGMLYVHGVEEDRESHETICKEYNEGVSFGGWKKERVVKRINSGVERIIEVGSLVLRDMYVVVIGKMFD